MSVIKVKTEDQNLKIISLPKITSGNQNIDFLSIFLDDTWDYDNISIEAIFFNKYGYRFRVDVEKDGDKYFCKIPSELTKKPGKICCGLMCKSGDRVIKTTGLIEIKIDKGANFDSMNIYIDYEKFIQDLIKILNDIFSLNLSCEATIEDILDALNTTTDGKKVSKFFIDLINSNFKSHIKYDDSESIITEIVEDIAESHDELKENYDYLVDNLLIVIGGESD